MKRWIKLGLILILAVAIIIPGCAKEAPAPAPAPTPAPAPAPKPAPAPAPKPKDDAAAFYKGKVITWVIPFSPGGGYDTYARLIAPFLQKYTGASNVIARNITGGGSLVGTNHVYNVSKRDGLTVSIIMGSAMTASQIVGSPEVKFDLAKFNWLARPAWDRAVLFISAKAPFRSVDEMRAAKAVRLGTTGRYSMEAYRSATVAPALGLTNLKIVHGYAGSTENKLAVVRGETDGACHSIASVIDVILSGDTIALVTLDHERDQMIPDTPTIYEVGVSEEGRKWLDWWVGMEKIGRGIVTTPDVPKARADFLRKAVMKSLSDKEFLARAKKANRPLDVLSGEEMLKLVQKSVTLSKEEIKELKQLLEKY